MALIKNVKFTTKEYRIDFNKISDANKKELAYILWQINNKKKNIFDYYAYICWYFFKEGIPYNKQKELRKEINVWKDKLPEEVRMLQIKRRDWLYYDYN